METMTQRIFRIIISNIGALIVFAAMLVFGIENIPLVAEYWKIPFSLLVTFLVIEDYKIITGRS